MIERRHISVWGAVQGVGFRPFAYLLAQELGLCGFVINTSQGALIEAEGEASSLDEFVHRLKAELPSPGMVAGTEELLVHLVGEGDFSIRTSEGEGAKSALILPDLAPCALCLAEVGNPRDRRFGYAFTNCTHCGPRYSIIRSLPYDRPNTSMAGFVLCPACRKEYEDPSDRRFHAQPTCCPQCGPMLSLVEPNGASLCEQEFTIRRAATLLKEGQILAIKGIGGFHLMVDARDEEAVVRLRERKKREFKPLAVMVPSLEEARLLAVLSPEEEELLTSQAAPIVIARSKEGLAPSVAPDNPNLGIMLPSSPLHHLLMKECGMPLVATSGNLTDEPLCIENEEAMKRLAGIADAFLLHDRPIVRPIDDSICRMLGERPAVLRRARGYAPLPFPLAGAKPGIAAFGSHLKGSAVVSGEGKVVVGQHVGDLDNHLARLRLEEEIRDLSAIQESEITLAVHDLHPDYASTLSAQAAGVKTVGVQHHLAHALSLMAEHDFKGPILAVVWDGTGLGLDGTIWGGEFILVDGKRAERVGHLRPFLLPGGDSASRQGWRSALGLLHEMGVQCTSISHPRADQVKSLLAKGTGCTKTTSAGRLFDAAAALGAGIMESRFEGDAAMRWECLASTDEVDPYPISVRDGLKKILDWAPALTALQEDPDGPALKSARFHAALAQGIGEMAANIGVEAVGLTGGCFQNQLLSRQTCCVLRRRGMTPLEHLNIPPNDGGIAFGQAVAAVWDVRFDQEEIRGESRTMES